MHMAIFTLILFISGCSIHNETLDIGSGLLTVKMEDSKPKVRMATGLDECRWRGKGNITEGEYEAHFQCSIPTDRFTY